MASLMFWIFVAYNAFAIDSSIVVTGPQKLIFFIIIMPVENLEEQGLEKNPDLKIAEWHYLLTTDKYKDDKLIRDKILNAITENGMWKLCFYDRPLSDNLRPDNTPIQYWSPNNAVIMKYSS